MSKYLFFSNFKDWQLNYLSCDLCLVPSAFKGKAAELYLRIKSKTFAYQQTREKPSTRTLTRKDLPEKKKKIIKKF